MTRQVHRKSDGQFLRFEDAPEPQHLWDCCSACGRCLCCSEREPCSANKWDDNPHVWIRYESC